MRPPLAPCDVCSVGLLAVSWHVCALRSCDRRTWRCHCDRLVTAIPHKAGKSRSYALVPLRLLVVLTRYALALRNSQTLLASLRSLVQYSLVPLVHSPKSHSPLFALPPSPYRDVGRGSSLKWLSVEWDSLQSRCICLRGVELCAPENWGATKHYSPSSRASCGVPWLSPSYGAPDPAPPRFPRSGFRQRTFFRAGAGSRGLLCAALFDGGGCRRAVLRTPAHGAPLPRATHLPSVLAPRGVFTFARAASRRIRSPRSREMW